MEALRTSCEVTLSHSMEQNSGTGATLSDYKPPNDDDDSLRGQPIFACSWSARRPRAVPFRSLEKCGCGLILLSIYRFSKATAGGANGRIEPKCPLQKRVEAGLGDAHKHFSSRERGTDSILTRLLNGPSSFPIEYSPIMRRETAWGCVRLEGERDRDRVPSLPYLACDGCNLVRPLRGVVGERGRRRRGTRPLLSRSVVTCEISNMTEYFDKLDRRRRPNKLGTGEGEGKGGGPAVKKPRVGIPSEDEARPEETEKRKKGWEAGRAESQLCTLAH